MADDRDQRIRERAYALWEEAGRQHGRDLLHWDQATRDIDGATPDPVEQEAEDSVEVVEVAKAATAAKRRKKAV